jgi:hypothetical protein
MGEIIQEYENLLNSIPGLIKKSKFKTSYFIDILDLPESTFYRKLKHKSFTIEEAKKISSIL